MHICDNSRFVSCTPKDDFDNICRERRSGWIRKIGAFLKTLRKEKGLTQAQLAEHFNVSDRSVSRWETGSNMPDLGLLVEIAEYYHLDVSEIIDGERKGEENGFIGNTGEGGGIHGG